MEELPESTVQRLPIYLRGLIEAHADGIDLVGSPDIAKMAGTNAAQVRKDLSYLGELGVRGVGYEVRGLIDHITKVLGLSTARRVAVIGAGRLGTALVSYFGMIERGFTVVSLFDCDRSRIGLSVGAVTVRDVSDLESALCEDCVDIAVITTPAPAAQEIADRVVASGVKALLSFAPVHVKVPEHVALRDVDLSRELQVLSFHLAQGE